MNPVTRPAIGPLTKKDEAPKSRVLVVRGASYQRPGPPGELPDQLLDGLEVESEGLAARTFAELLIDCEEDRALRAVLVGMLREGERNAKAH